MASYTVNLTGYTATGTHIRWDDNVALPTTFDDNGANQTLSQVIIRQSNQISLSILGTNRRFTPEFEESGRIIFTASDGETLEVMIDNEDMTEPYSWFPDNGNEITAFYQHERALATHDATLTLTDDDDGAAAAPSWTDDTGDAQDWVQNTAITAITVPEASGSPAPTYAATGLPAGITFDTGTRVISGTPTAVSSGTITVTATNSEGTADWTIAYTTTAAAVTELVLSDWDDTGLEVETAALLEAGDAGTSGKNFYLAVSRGGSGAPIEGELGVGSGETLIDRMRRASTQNLTLNDSNSPVELNFGVFFGTSGDGADLTIYLQTVADGLVSFTIASAFLSAGGNWLNVVLPAAARTLLDNLTTGDRFIFALARATPPAGVAHTVDAGDISWTFSLPQPTVTHTTPTPIAHAVDAGDISWTFTLPQPTVTHTTALPIAHAVDAGNIEWEFTLPQPTVTLVRSMPTAHAVDAGDISWTFDLPQPTVTLTKPSAVAYAIDAGDISWLFVLPQPTVTHVSSISPPAAPTAPTAADIGLDFVEIEWTPPASDAALTDYEVRIGLTGAWTSIESRTPRYRFGSLTKGTEYTFYVRAWSANGVGSASGGLTVTTHKGYVTDGLDVTDYGDLAILQWREARNFRIKIDTFLKIAQKRIIEPLRWIETHRSLPDAEGFMLDALGSKLGEDDGKRPSVSISGVNFFGFAGSGSTGFNQGKLKSINPLLAREPAGDTFYRGLLTLAYGALLTDSSQESLESIVQMVWADAEYRDLGTSAEFIATDTPTGLIDLADELGLLPRPSGVALTITKL